MRAYPVAECAHCGRERPIVARGWCNTCHKRWIRAGKPADLVIPPLRVVKDREGHLEDTRLMLVTGIRTIGRLCELVGVSRTTMHGYLRELGEEHLIPPRGRPTGWRAARRRAS